MKHLGMAILLVFAAIWTGCGGSSNSANTINGNWSASLTNSNPAGPTFAFTTTLNQSNGSTVTGTNLSFTTANSCFQNGDTETGSFILSGNFNGNVNGSFGLTIQSNAPDNNTLTLNGMVTNSVINGNWTLTGTGSGCTGTGTFTMNRM